LLNKIGLIIAETPCNVRIEGHTDNFPIHNVKYPSNWELSTARAVNVLRFFIENANIPAEKLSAVGFGKYHPVVPNDISANRAKNRRVEIIFIKK
jgi:chemotaxis protein MotB